MKEMIERICRACVAGWRVYKSERSIVVTQFTVDDRICRNYLLNHVDCHMIDKVMAKLEEVRWSDEMFEQ